MTLPFGISPHLAFDLWLWPYLALQGLVDDTTRPCCSLFSFEEEMSPQASGSPHGVILVQPNARGFPIDVQSLSTGQPFLK